MTEKYLEGKATSEEQVAANLDAWEAARMAKKVVKENPVNGFKNIAAEGAAWAAVNASSLSDPAWESVEETCRSAMKAVARVVTDGAIREEKAEKILR